jgi:hypothetical protein
VIEAVCTGRSFIKPGGIPKKKSEIDLSEIEFLLRLSGTEGRDFRNAFFDRLLRIDACRNTKTVESSRIK